MRPEAGFLPTLASGRSRDSYWDGARVTFLRARSREVYRVYTEEEYLNGAGLTPATLDAWPTDVEPTIGSVGEWPVAAEPIGEWAVEVGSAETELRDAPVGEHAYDGFVPPASKEVRARRLRRMAGAAMLVGALGAVGGVVIANVSRTHRGGGRRPESLVANTHSSKAVRSLAVTSASAAGRSPEITPSRVTQLERRRDGSDSRPTTRPTIPPSATRRSGGLNSRPPTNTNPSKHPQRVGPPSGSSPPSAGVGARRGEGVAVVVDDSAASSSGTTNAVGAPGGGSPATHSSAGPSVARTGAGQHVEFGFEH